MVKDLDRLMELSSMNQMLMQRLKTFNLLRDIIERCKCGVHITINEHRNVYEGVEEYFDGRKDFQEADDMLIFDMMVKTDTVIHLQVYPDTPVGFYDVYHFDLDQAVDIMAKTLMACDHASGYPKRIEEVSNEPQQD